MFSKNNLFYLLYLVLVVGVCAELIGQYYLATDGEYIYLKKRLLFVEDDELDYKLASNITIHGNDNRLYPGVEIKTNGLGLRSLPIDTKKKHMLALGDSVAPGYSLYQALDTCTNEVVKTFDYELSTTASEYVTNCGGIRSAPVRHYDR